MGMANQRDTSPTKDPSGPRTARLNKHEYTPGFEEVWAAYPRKVGASKWDAFKAFRARLTEGATREEIMAGVQAYAAYVKAQGTSQQYMKLPETFFGPAHHYMSDWSIPDPNAPKPVRMDGGRSLPVGDLLDFYDREELI